MISGTNGALSFQNLIARPVMTSTNVMSEIFAIYNAKLLLKGYVAFYDIDRGMFSVLTSRQCCGKAEFTFIKNKKRMDNVGLTPGDSYNLLMPCKHLFKCSVIAENIQ